MECPGVTHRWGFRCWDVKQWLIFNPLHTRPQQMTTCREAKQGMRRDQDNWNFTGSGSWEELWDWDWASLPLCAAQ